MHIHEYIEFANIILSQMVTQCQLVKCITLSALNNMFYGSSAIMEAAIFKAYSLHVIAVSARLIQSNAS